MGPESRIHPRSVGTSKNVMASKSAPDFRSISFTRDLAAWFSTSRLTRSTRVRCLTISAKAHGIGANLPGQSVSSWGHPSQVASCGSHSAGMRRFNSFSNFAWPRLSGLLRRTQTPRGYVAGWPGAPRPRARLATVGRCSLAEPTAEDRLVRIHAPVAQERPIAAGFLAFRGIAFDHEDFFLVLRGLGHHLSERVGDKGIAPELKPGITCRVPALKAHPVYDRDIDSVRDGVTALNRFPGVELRCAEFRFLCRMPADARGIENYLRTTKRHRPRALRVPLIPADLHADAAAVYVERRKTEVTRGEVKLLVVQRVVRDVHLAISAQERSVGVNHRAGVVVQARGAALEQGSDDCDFGLARNGREHVGRGPGKRFGKIKKVGVFCAAEILAVKQLVHADDLCASLGGFAYLLDRAGEILRRILG